jgi:Transposase DDE domain
VPKAISPSDPCSAWTAKANKRVQFGYGLNYLIDTQNAVIVDVEATPARTYDEVAATKTMIDRTEKRFALRPKRLAADTAYGTGKFLGWLVNDKRITPHIRSGRGAIARTVSSRALTSSGTSGMATTSVPTASRSAPAARCMTGARCSIAPRNETAMPVL